MQYKIDDAIGEIETDIKSMRDNKVSFKKMVDKYNEIDKKITKCQQQLKTYSDKLGETVEASSSEDGNQNIDVADDLFMSLLEELNQLKNNVSDNKSLDELMKLYASAQERIKLCDRYLHKQKLEIIKT
jgi:uncharacterized protein YdcH (DUF465 family)